MYWLKKEISDLIIKDVSKACEKPQKALVSGLHLRETTPYHFEAIVQ